MLPHFQASKDTIEKLKTDVHKQTSEMEKLRSLSSNQEQKIRDMTKMLAKQGLEINKLEENSKNLASKEQLARHEAELTTLKTKVVSQESTVAGLGSRTTGNIPGRSNNIDYVAFSVKSLMIAVL